MYSFRIKIASHIFQVETFFEYSYYACRNFLTDEEAECMVCLTPEDVDRERKNNEPNCLDNQRHKSDKRIEFLALHRKICEKLIEFNTIMVHGAAISLDNNAFIVCGRSGIGKSTHAFMWTDNFPRAHVINGDKPFIIINENQGGILVCGSPWAGKEGMTENAIVPLNSIVILERSEDNHVHRISLSEAFPYLLQQVFLPEETNKKIKVLNLLKTMNEKVSFFHFKINNFKDDCITKAYDALFNGKES